MAKDKTVYVTNEWKGFGKSYYHNEYRDEGDSVAKYKVGRVKVFDGDESDWNTTETLIDSWDKTDEAMPDWLKDKLDDMDY